MSQSPETTEAKLPTITCSSIHAHDARIVKACYSILADYLRRFNLDIVKDKASVKIVFVATPDKDNTRLVGRTTYGTNKDGPSIYIEIKDPVLNDLEINEFAEDAISKTVAHEMIHACQFLTGRYGIRPRIPHDNQDSFESYYFKPNEMEARLLEDFYVAKYMQDIFKDTEPNPNG